VDEFPLTNTTAPCGECLASRLQSKKKTAVDVRLLYDPIDETQAVACKGKVVECASNTGLIETDAGEVRAVRAWAGR
jgi:hypothetical protein